ncbi:polysaccharide deacetylase [Legionella busanensis]|uniref:Polysaccharide deacetylase n=1 Tax=Legionella busanensis TaxID=190655 RepID=A0A378JL74_9GAMM|nr:polysaccharide deacetylase family protein [Legionella busanensis]STX52086.1 polysaccharide deacetylase [Legionella busanensis]
MFKFFWLPLALFSSICYAQEREIAITMDDLPLVASQMNTEANQQRSRERFTNIINTFTKYHVPVTGFVIAGSIEKGQWDFLQQFINAGFIIGNHTYSHPNLNKIGAEKYIKDMDRADKILSPLFSTPKYFRYPYLAEGSKQTKQKILTYLKEHNYIVAPVTIDSKDFEFNEKVYKVPFRSREKFIQKIKSKYLAYIWQQTLNAEKRSNKTGNKQILLIHANLLNSYLLGDILEMYQKNGYKFISLAEALESPAPSLIFPIKDNEVETQPEETIKIKL